MKTTFLLITLFLFITRAFPQTPQWEFMGLASEEIYDIVIDDSSNVFVGSDGGVFKSSDNGTTWIFKNNGLQIAEVRKLFIDYDGNIYLGAVGLSSTGCGLYKSSDGGEYWAKIADTLNGNPINNFNDVTVIPNEPGGFIYVSNYYGVYRSTDNGITWQSTNYSNPCAIHIGINQNGYMFFGNGCASWFGLYRSTDLGLNWIRHTFLSVEDAMIYLSDGSVLAGCYDPGLGSSGIYKTTDDGNIWFNTNTFSGILTFTDFVCDTNTDIYVSIIGQNFGVYLSSNKGSSWIGYGLSNPQYAITCLAIDSLGYVWAGTNMHGIYRAEGRRVPVEFISFTAETVYNSVLLKWITATEINNQGFEIQKKESEDRSQESEWDKIGFVDGHGTTTETQSYSFIDNDVLSGKVKYRLKQIDFDGTFEYSNEIEVDIDITPKEFVLHQNYPNPFNPTTKIKFTIPTSPQSPPSKGGEAKQGWFTVLKVYDILGNEVATLVNENKPAGSYEVEFNAEGLASGVYFYRIAIHSDQLKTGNHIATKKLVVLK